MKADSGPAVAHSTPTQNPFPGPHPYRAEDRSRFFGREDATRRLASRVMAHACTMVFGPPGAGKSSLLQAGVIPWLEERHAFRVVRVDGWPPGEAPLPWLARAIAGGLGLGDAPGGQGPAEALAALKETIAMAERRSERPLLIALDHLEQIFSPARHEGEAAALIEGLYRLARTPMHGLQLALCLREDCLGRFGEAARDRRELLDHGFRVEPLNVGEMAQVVRRVVEATGAASSWNAEETRATLLQARAPGTTLEDAADVDMVAAQIALRARWDEHVA